MIFEGVTHVNSKEEFNEKILVYIRMVEELARREKIRIPHETSPSSEVIHEMIDMGVILNDGTGHLQLVGDFWGTGLNEATFQDELARAYQRINIETQAELNGWTIDEESVVENADGSVEMEVYMYA